MSYVENLRRRRDYLPRKSLPLRANVLDAACPARSMRAGRQERHSLEVVVLKFSAVNCSGSPVMISPSSSILYVPGHFPSLIVNDRRASLDLALGNDLRGVVGHIAKLIGSQR